MRWRIPLLAVLGMALGAFPAGALTLDFEEFVHGEIADESHGVLITTENFNDAWGHPDLGIAFDTTETGTRDPDLEQGAGWAGGNIPLDEVLGHILIVQENESGCLDDSICNFPDDEGRRPAGSFTLDFSDLGTFQTFRFDLVDVETAEANMGSIKFFDGEEEEPFAEWTFASFLGLGQGVAYENNAINRVDLTERLRLLGGEFDEVVITMGGSGGVDNIVVPEPETFSLFGLALAGLGLARSRSGG